MNKKYDRTDQERDQSRRLEQGEAEKQKARQDGVRDRGQQQSGGEPRRQYKQKRLGSRRRNGRADCRRALMEGRRNLPVRLRFHGLVGHEDVKPMRNTGHEIYGSLTLSV